MFLVPAREDRVRGSFELAETRERKRDSRPVGRSIAFAITLGGKCPFSSSESSGFVISANQREASARNHERIASEEARERGLRLREIIEDNFLGPWPRLVLPCPLNFHVRGCDHLAVTCSLALHAYVKRWLPMTNGEKTGIGAVQLTNEERA